MTGDVTVGGFQRLSFPQYANITNLVANSSGTQAGGTIITAAFSRFVTVAGPGYSGVMPPATPGRNMFIQNAGANSMLIYPAGSDSINALAASAAFNLAAGGFVEVFCTLAGNWTFQQSQSGFASVNATLYGTNISTGANLLTAANISGANDVTLNMTGTQGSGSNATLPTVAALAAAIPNAAAGESYNLRVINSGAGAFPWTIVTNTGWTLTGTMTIAQNTFRDFYVTFTTLSAATLQSVGTGTNS
jgi:hypothetical protein